MPSKSGFEKLDVYRIAEDLSDELYRCVRTWPALDRDTVGKQMIRSADSIGANLAEGYGRMAVVDHRRFVKIALGLLYETKHWLRRAYRRKLFSDDQITSLAPMLERLLPMLNGYLKSIGRTAVVPTHDLRPTTHD